jgi:hypothetical protein
MHEREPGEPVFARLGRAGPLILECGVEELLLKAHIDRRRAVVADFVVGSPADSTKTEVS